MKKVAKKLSLSRETLRILGRDALAQAAGGTVFTCAACWVTGPPSECVSECVVCPEPDPTAFC
jgi:hypothetical protein